MGISPAVYYCKTGSEECKGERAQTCFGREPLQYGEEGNAAFNMTANERMAEHIFVILSWQQSTPKSSNTSSDSSAVYNTPSGSSSASVPIHSLKLDESAFNDRRVLV